MMELPALCRKLEGFLTGELDRSSIDADKAIANTMSYHWVYERWYTLGVHDRPKGRQANSHNVSFKETSDICGGSFI